MEAIHIQAEQAVRLDGVPGAACTSGFYWLDLTHDEFVADPERARELVAVLGGARIHDLHMQDAANLQHPSFYDSTSHYDMLIFRKLSPGDAPPLAQIPPGAGARPRQHRLQEIVTRPVTFFAFEHLLVTVRSPQSRTLDQVRQRMLEFRSRPSMKASPLGGESVLTRLPQRPEELMLRLLNGMVDRYLELRQPLTDRLDRMQRELLDPRRSFSDWTALLDARIEMRRLENLCDEQLDALQEWRDTYLEATPEPQQSDAFLVRLADVIEHVKRVLGHAARLEGSLENAVQLHFSATAYRTNQVVRTLTAITAIFAPLTLITGVFGMNFQFMPLLHEHFGFWITVAAMFAIALALLLYFSVKRILADAPARLGRRRRPPATDQAG
jgi:Mg2+ and Co2+ transporter CorA